MPKYRMSVDVKKIYKVDIAAKDVEEAREIGEAMQTTEIEKSGDVGEIETEVLDWVLVENDGQDIDLESDLENAVTVIVDELMGDLEMMAGMNGEEGIRKRFTISVRDRLTQLRESERKRWLWRLGVEDAQDMARSIHGVELDDEGIRSVKKGVEFGMGEAWPTILDAAVECAVHEQNERVNAREEA